MPDYIYKGKRYSDKQMETFAKDNGLSLNDYASQVGATYVAPGEQTFQYKDKEYSKTQIETFAKDNSLSFDDYLKETGTVKKKGGLASMLTGAASSVGGMVGSGAGRSEEGNKKDIWGKFIEKGGTKIEPDVETQIVPNPIDDPVGAALHPLIKAHNKASEDYNKFIDPNRAASESTGQLQVNTTPSLRQEPNFEYSVRNNKKQTEKALNVVSNELSNSVFKNGKQARDYLVDQYQRRGGNIPENNLTVQLASSKADRLTNFTQYAQNSSSLINMAVNMARDNDAHLDKTLSTIEGATSASFGGNSEVIKKLIEYNKNRRYADHNYYSDPNDTERFPQQMVGYYVSQLIKDPDIEDAVNESGNESLKKELTYLRNGGIYERLPQYGLNQIDNLVSHAREQMHKNTIVWNPSSPYDNNINNKIAEELFKDQPQLKKLYEENRKDNWSGHLDKQSLVKSAWEGFKMPVEGSGEALKDIIGAGDTESERLYSGLKGKYGSVSSGVSGWKKDLFDATHFLGMVGGMAALGRPFSATKLPAWATNAIITSGAFYDQELNDWTSKYPGERGKARIGALLSTAAYSAAAHAFPSVKIGDAIAGKMSVDIKNALNNFTEGAITKEAREGLIQKFSSLIKNIGGGTAKGASEMTAVTLFKQELDKLMGLDKRTFDEVHHEGELYDVAKSMVIGGLFPNAIRAVGNRNAVAKSLNSIASEPQRIIDVLSKNMTDPSQKEELKKKIDDIIFLHNIKVGLVQNDIQESKHGKYLLNAMNQKYASDKAKATPDANLRRVSDNQSRYSEQTNRDIIDGKELSNEKQLIQDALADGTLKGQNAVMADLALKDESGETAKQFIQMVKEQSANKISTQEGVDTRNNAINDFGNELVDFASPLKIDTNQATSEAKAEQPSTVLSRGDETGLSEDANKILGLHDNGVNFDLFDNAKLRQIAKDNGIEISEGAKNADIIEALKNKKNELANKKSEAQDVNESIGTSDNTETILETAEKKGGIYSQLAKAVKNLLGGVKTIVTNAFKSDVSEHGDYGQNEIRINNKTDKNKLHIFFHEALHHITRGKIEEFESNPNSKNLKPEEVQAILNLKRIFKNVTEKLNQDAGGFGTQKGGQSPTNIWLLDATGNKRGLANVHEFISEAFTNPEFQKLLKDFKGEGKQPNLFKQFLDAVAKMLGLKDPTILDDIFHHTEKLAEQKDPSLSTNTPSKEQTTASKVAEEAQATKKAALEAQRDADILREKVPEMPNVNNVVPTREAVSAGSNADNLTANKRKRADLKNRYTDLKKLFECLTK